MQAKFGENELVQFLQKLRIFNKIIGAYEGFVLTEHFRYAVKLSNGRIIISPHELILDESEKLTPNELVIIAKRFELLQYNEAGEIIEPVVIKKAVSSRSWLKKIFSRAAMFLIIIFAGLAMINKEGPAIPKPEVGTEPETRQEIQQVKKENQEQGSSVVAETKKQKPVEELERERPAGYLVASGTYRGNLWESKLKLECTVKNKARETTYANAVLRVIYLNKEQETIATKEYPLENKFSPKSTTSLQLKIDRFKKTEFVELEIVKAKPVNVERFTLNVER